MKKTYLILLILLAGSVWAAPVTVDGVRVRSDNRGAWLEMGLSRPAEFRVFSLHGPERLVVDVQPATLGGPEFDVSLAGGPIVGVRTGMQAGDTLRVVLDLASAMGHDAKLLPAGGAQRLLVSLGGEVKPAREDKAPAPPPAVKPAPAPEAKPAPTPQRPARPALRDIIVAIDAGHGGRDPGAIGSGGTLEKVIVLQIARRLAALIDKEPGMRALLVRDGDRFIALRDRIAIAREHQADLFISIHADSFKNFAARGSSVYVLSHDGATSEAARWLAESENAADLRGGVTLDDRDQMLASVLLDMSQTKTIEESADLAARVLKELAPVGRLHSSSVQRAGFAVLKSPDIPSLLVETGFISNPEEERKLREPAHQYRIAAAVLRAVRGFTRESAPPGTWLAEGRTPPAPTHAAADGGLEYTIRRGDTLYSISRRYKIELERLRRANGLNGTSIKVGDVLRIPAEVVDSV